MRVYRLLLVDDERIIREGIINLVDWESLSIEVDEAMDGFEAYNAIKTNHYDMVITDIKMPGLNGLQLIGKVQEEFPHIVFAILSGYGEFEFASTAMKFGVKHYLLKPCDEEDIVKVVEDIIKDLEQKREREQFIRDMEEKWDTMAPYVREQFLRDCILGRHNVQQQRRYLKTLELDIGSVQLLTFRLDIEHEFESLYALKDLAETLLIKYRFNVVFGTIVGTHAIILIEPADFEELINCLREIKSVFYDYYQRDITIAVSDKGSFQDLALLYSQTKECLKYRFYLGEGSIITSRDIKTHQMGPKGLFVFDYERVTLAIKSGDVKGLNRSLQTFFQELQDKKYDINTTKTYCMELYVLIIRQAEPSELDEYIKKIDILQRLDTIDEISDFILSIGREISKRNFERNMVTNNSIIKKVLETMESNIDNENLSLSWISREVIYMNEDYVGKLFKKEMKENFSTYLIRRRMERAKSIIEKMPEYSIAEIAEKVGYGNNPQYFSQVFKKHTGSTPSDYKNRKLEQRPDY